MAASTPRKFFSFIKYTPRTKKFICLLCGNKTEDSNLRRKLFQGSSKTEYCVLIEKYLHIDINPDTHTDTVCRKCAREINKVNETVLKLKSNYERTISSLLESHGQETSKRLASLEPETSVKKRNLFPGECQTGSEDIDQYFQPFSETDDYKENKDSSQNRDAKLVQLLECGNIKEFSEEIFQIPNVLECLKNKIYQILQSEIRNIVSKGFNSVLRRKDKQAVQSFSLEKVLKEWQKEAPVFLEILETIVSNPSQTRNKCKKDDALLPGIVSVGSKLLSIHNQELSLFQHINSIILLKGGCKKSTFRRLNSTFDCLSYPATLALADRYGADWDRNIRSWQVTVEQDRETEDQLMNSVHVYEELVRVHQDVDRDPEFTLALSSARQDLQQHRKNMHPGYYFVGDNVDLRTKVRNMTITNQNKDQHMFQICAYENRVSGNHLDNSGPKTNIDTYNFKNLIPGEHEKKCFLSEAAFLVAQQWSKYIPHFLPYINVLPKYISHEYLKEMKTRTNRASRLFYIFSIEKVLIVCNEPYIFQINLGVLMKCEQYNEDMTDICEFLHTFVPGHETNDNWQKKPDKVLSGGDYLTFERHKQAQSSKRNGRTPSKRLQGLIPKMEEFHNQAELLKVIWSLLYNTSSARNQGTLYAARNTLNSRNVTQHSSQDFYACSDLVEKVTLAYIVTGGLEYFGMDTLNTVPTKNMYSGAIGDKKEMCEYILDHASEFAKQFCVPDTPLLPEYGPQSLSLICRYCNKEYKRPKSLRKHEATVHGHPDPLYGDANITEITTQTSEDGVFNYTRLMLNLGLLRMNHNDAIRMGDGERIMRINPKYAYGLLETKAQTNMLLTERMAHRLIWNRTVNHRGYFD
ncbi:uncharacterized protein LOC134233123 [Saccostrea cucullata]|uniref:uncharacterized protein LOC134233123 n=1 Tax=Saccostrea cuccullata TaxID=36930 RepID=UPI002ED6175F